MARRVNTRFLIVLTLLVVGGGVSLIAIGKGIQHMRRDPGPHIEMAQAYEREGDLEQAARHYAHAASLSGRDPALRVTLGDVLNRLAHADQVNLARARAEWERALEIDPGHVPALNRLLDLYATESRLLPRADAELFRRLRTTAERLVRIDENDHGARAAYHISYIQSWQLGLATPDQNLEEAVQTLTVLMERDPQNADLPFFLAQERLHRAQQQLRVNQPIQASRLLAEAVGLFDVPLAAEDVNAEMHWRAGQIYLHAARLEQRDQERRRQWLDAARASAQRAMELTDPASPHYTEILTFAAGVHPQAPGGEAERILRELYDQRPQDLFARMQLARFLAQFPATRAEAVQLFEKPVVAGPDVVGIRAIAYQGLEMQLILDLADARLKLYQNETDPAARERLMAAIEQGINRAQNRLGETSSVLRLRGEMHLLRNRPVEAVQALNRAMAMQTQQNQPVNPELLLSLARANIAVQQHGRAVQLLRQVLTHNERFVPAHVMLAELLLREQRIEEARVHVDALEQIIPDEPDVMRLRLATLNVANNREEIERYYARLPEDTPQRRLQKAQIAIRIANIEEAERLLTEVLAEAPQELAASELLIRLYAGRNRRDEAVNVLAAAQQHHPGHQGLEVLRMQLLEASPQDLIRFIEDEIAKMPDEFARELQYAVLFRDSGDPERSFTHLNNARRLKPNDPQLLELLFGHHLRAREWEAAQRYMDQLARGNHDQAGGLLYRYRLAMARGELQSAINIARDLTQRMPEFAQSWIALAQALQATGQIEPAASNYLRALEIQGANLEALRGAVECLVALNRTEEARQQIVRGRQLFPNEGFFLEQEINHELNHGDPDRALARLQEIFDRAPDVPQSWLALASGHLRAGQLRNMRNQRERARVHLERARELFAEAAGRWPDEQAFHAHSAELALVSNQPEEAWRILTRFAEREQWRQRPEPHLLFADYYLRLNQPEEAEASLRQALRRADEQQDLPIRLRLAALLAGTQKVDAALQMLDSRRSEPQVARQRIEILINAARNEEAERELLAVLEREPQAADLLTLLGLAQLNLNRPAEAIASFDRSLGIDSDRPQALYLRGLARLRLPQRDMDGAIADLSAARNRDGRNQDYRFALAEAFQINNQPANAVRELTVALGETPANKQLRLALIEMHSRMSPPRWPEVERLLRDARNLPEIAQDPDWHHVEAMMWSAREQPDRALAAAERARQADPANPVYLQQFLGLLLQTQRYQRLLDETDELVRVAGDVPGIHRIHLMRGVARRHLDDGDGALADFQRALTVATAQSDDAGALEVINTISRELGVEEALARIGDRIEQSNRWKLIAAQLHFARPEHSVAISLVEQVLAQFDELEESEQLAVLRVAGGFYLSTEPPQVDKAHQTYLRLLERAPDDVIALNNMAYLLVQYMDPPRPEQALTYSQRAYEQMQQAGVTEPLIMDTHGWVLTQAGRVDEGIAVLHQAADRRSFPEVHYHLGEAYLKRSLVEQAQTQLQRASELIEEQERANLPVNAALKQNVKRALLRAQEMAQAAPEASAR